MARRDFARDTRMGDKRALPPAPPCPALPPADPPPDRAAKAPSACAQRLAREGAWALEAAEDGMHDRGGGVGGARVEDTLVPPVGDGGGVEGESKF